MIMYTVFKNQMGTVLLCVFALLVVHVSSNPEKIAIAVNEIISLTFKNDKCLVGILEQCEMTNYVETALLKLQVPIFLTTFQDVKNFTKKIAKCSGYLISLKSLSQLKELFRSSSENDTFTHHKRVLVFYESQGKLSNYASLSDAYLNGTEIIIVHRNLQSLQVTFTWTDNTVTVLNATGHLNIVPDHYSVKPWKPKLKNKFRVSTFHCPPFVLHDEKRGGYGGPELNIIREMTKDWPVEYYFHGPGSWFKIVDDVSRRKSDVAMCSLWQTPASKTADTSHPFAQICVTFLVSKPQLLSDISYVFQPFQLTLWILIIVVLVLVSYVLYLLHATEKLRATVIYKADIVSAFLDAIRLFTLGSLSRPPKSTQHSLRHVLISFSITCLILSTAYSAGFTSSLTYPRYTKPIRTVEDMIEQNVKIEVEPKETNIKELFEGFSDPHIRSLSDYIVFVSENETRHENTKYAKFVKVAGMKYVTDTENLDSYSKTHLVLLKGCISKSNVVFVLQRNSVYTDIINKYTQRFVEYGFVRYWFKQAIYLSKDTYFDNFYSLYVNKFGHGSLKIERLKGVFIMLTFGLATATLIFIAELLYYKRSHKFTL